jgi:hypothetical protein
MDPRDDALSWALTILEQEMKNRAYGAITIILEAGVIVRAKVERSEKPPERRRLQAHG